MFHFHHVRISLFCFAHFLLRPQIFCVAKFRSIHGSTYDLTVPNSYFHSDSPGSRIIEEEKTVCRFLCSTISRIMCTIHFGSYVSEYHLQMWCLYITLCVCVHSSWCPILCILHMPKLIWNAECGYLLFAHIVYIVLFYFSIWRQLLELGPI